MEFDFPEELKLLRGTAQALLGETCAPGRAREVIEGADPRSPELWAQMAEMGWLAATVPETLGGLELGPLAVCVLAEELGRVVAPVPYASTVYLAAEALSRFGSESQRAHWLPQLCDGRARGTLAFVEALGSVSAERFQTHAKEHKLNGTKIAVPDLAGAEFAVVATRPSAHRDACLWLLELDQDGIDVVAEASLDPSRPLSRLRLCGARAEPLPGAREDYSLQQLLQRAAVPMAFEQLGVAQAALDMACAHARERYAFGRPIGSFQAIKHKLVDVYVAIELARSNALFGAWALQHDDTLLPRAAAAARVAASQAAWLATKENIQVHGGMGFTWALDCHLFYRRAQWLGSLLGTSREWRRALVVELDTADDSVNARDPLTGVVA